MKVKDILSFLNQKYPLDTACDFDNVGLLIGDKDQTVSKAVVTLDCTMSAIRTALQNGAELIITHHPVIFNPLKNVLKGSIVYEAVKNNLSVISMHTNLDIGEGGVNDCLCDLLSPLDKQSITASDGYLLKKCTISPTTPDQLAQKLKTALGTSIKYTDCTEKIEKVLVCAGSGGEFISEAKDFDCDALITADVKHNHFMESELYNISLFDAGHFHTEDIVIEPLTKMLKSEFPSIQFTTNHKVSIKSR